MLLKYFIYARKSVDTGKGESIENQIEMCKKYIANLTNPDDQTEFYVYTDKGFSGKNTQRPDFKKMKQDIERLHPDCVICYRLDRITRSVGDFAEFNRFLQNHRVSFISINEKFDTSSPMGMAMMNIAAVFAQLERETTAIRVRDNMYELAKKGCWLGGTAPLGYYLIKKSELSEEDKKAGVSRLIINPEEAEIVMLIFTKFIETKHISAVSKILIKKGIKARNGKDYSLLGIKEILQNPVYATADEDSLAYFKKYNAQIYCNPSDFDGERGLTAYNKRDQSTSAGVRNSVDKWIISLGKHKGLITGKEWVAAQEIIRANSKEEENKKHSNEHNDYSLLSGKIICGKCGSRMFAKRRSKSKSGLFDYICNSKLKGGEDNCDCKNLAGQQTDDAVFSSVIGENADSSAIITELENYKNQITYDIKYGDDIGKLERQLETINKQRHNLIRNLSTGIASDELISSINTELSRLKDEEADINKELEKLKLQVDNQKDVQVQINAFIAMLSTFNDCCENMNVYEKRELVNILVEKIEWDGEELSVFRYDE